MLDFFLKGLALEPVAFSLIKDTFQLTSLVAELLNVMKGKSSIKSVLWPMLPERLRKYAKYAIFLTNRGNRAQKIMQK